MEPATVTLHQRRRRVYVAGPITKGDQYVNARNGILMGKELYEAGYAPYVPHLTCLWQIVAPMPYEAWLTLDNEYLVLCDALLRLPGESPGADREVALARQHGIPVFHALSELTSQLAPVVYE